VSEAQFHNTAASFLNAVLDPHVFWTTVGHGGFPLHPKTASRLKRAGVKAGVPDVLIVSKGHAYFLELKTPKGTLSTAQKACHADLVIAGTAAKVCRSLDDIQAALAEWQIPLRARVA
jgi:hypothetical protein